MSETTAFVQRYLLSPLLSAKMCLLVDLAYCINVLIDYPLSLLLSLVCCTVSLGSFIAMHVQHLTSRFTNHMAYVLNLAYYYILCTHDVLARFFATMSSNPGSHRSPLDSKWRQLYKSTKHSEPSLRSTHSSTTVVRENVERFGQ